MRMSDPGPKGTLRWIRMAELGLLQGAWGAQFGKDQATVSDFERGRLWLTIKVAKAIAATLPEYSKGHDMAYVKVLRAWVESVRHNNPRKLIEAQEYVERIIGFTAGPLFQSRDREEAEPCVTRIDPLPDGRVAGQKVVSA